MTAGADMLRQLHIAIIRLDDKVDNIAKRLDKVEVALDRRLTDHEDRLRLIESRPYVEPATVWKVLGFCMSVLALGATIVGMIIK